MGYIIYKRFKHDKYLHENSDEIEVYNENVGDMDDK